MPRKRRDLAFSLGLMRKSVPANSFETISQEIMIGKTVQFSEPDYSELMASASTVEETIGADQPQWRYRDEIERDCSELLNMATKSVVKFYDLIKQRLDISSIDKTAFICFVFLVFDYAYGSRLTSQGERDYFAKIFPKRAPQEIIRKTLLEIADLSPSDFVKNFPITYAQSANMFLPFIDEDSGPLLDQLVAAELFRANSDAVAECKQSFPEGFSIIAKTTLKGLANTIVNGRLTRSG